MLDSRHAVLAMKQKQTSAGMWTGGSDKTQNSWFVFHMSRIQNLGPATSYPDKCLIPSRKCMDGQDRCLAYQFQFIIYKHPLFDAI
jgi:hypothetical protein